MTRVITYGTFDLFHEGHRRILERAREHGDHLTVGVTTEQYDEQRGKLNVRQSLMTRIENVRASGLADEIIIEERDGQKITDIQKHGIDVFVIGSDWTGKFDYLGSYCRVVYLDRTAGVSSTELRAADGGILRLGIVGAGRIARRFVPESKYVSGVEAVGVCTPHRSSAEAFAAAHELSFATTSYDDLLDRVDAVYIASPHDAHVPQTRAALAAGKHVLCEKPIALTGADAEQLYALAADRGVVLLEAIKTAYSPGFVQMVALARSGSIGEIRSVQATFTKLVEGNPRERHADGGSTRELASYPLLAIAKLLGTDVRDVHRDALTLPGSEIDDYARLTLRYDGAIGTAVVGLGVKAEGDLVAAGTAGYLYVPAPWWKAEAFELRFEDPSRNRRYTSRFDGEGLRYELAEFLSLITHGRTSSYKLSAADSTFIASTLEQALAQPPLGAAPAPVAAIA